MRFTLQGAVTSEATADQRTLVRRLSGGLLKLLAPVQGLPTLSVPFLSQQASHVPKLFHRSFCADEHEKSHSSKWP